MRLSPEIAAHAAKEYESIRPRLDWLNVRILSELDPKLKDDRAREYLRHGVGRRIKTIGHCLANVFTIFPPSRTLLLNPDELYAVQINLQAFVMNVYGTFDNVAWVYMLEQGRDKTIDRRGIGLFDKRTQAYLSQQLCDYLTTKTLAAWHADYAKNFRDALAHRIPLYVAPFIVTPQENERWQAIDAQILPAIKAQEFDRAESLRARVRSGSFRQHPPEEPRFVLPR